MIYRFRVILDNDTKDDIFLDLEIKETSTLEDLNNIITQSFGFDGTEMASFYLSDDEWNQGEEISLFDLSEGTSSVKVMSKTLLKDVINESCNKLIYVYDFLNMWTFFVELAAIVKEIEGTDYPKLISVHGQIPDEAPKKSFIATDEFENFNELKGNLNIEDYEDLDFNENWN